MKKNVKPYNKRIMENNDIITQMLETSHRRHRDSAATTSALANLLNNRRWHRRTTRAANTLSVMIVLLAAGFAMTWVPMPEYSSYKTSQNWSTPQADCLMLHKVIERG